MLREVVRMGLSPLVMGAKLVKNRMDPPVLILLYHRVTMLASDPQLLAVSPARFHAHMQYLKDNFTLARLEEDWSELKKPAVVITFDDGYADNALEALPVLEQLQVPATFFVSTSLIGTDREFWWDEVERVLLTERPFPPHFEMVASGEERRWSTGDLKERTRTYQELLPILRRSAPELRDSYLERLRVWAGAGDKGRESHRVLSMEELRKLAASPMVTLGAHTLTHSSLSALSPARQADEIVGSKLWLEKVLGQEVQVFSYPFGTTADYTAETVDLCRDAGFSRTVSNFPGQWRADTDPQQLPRQIVRNWDLATFTREISRFWIS